MVRLLRIILMVVLFFLVMGVVMAIGRPETGPLEKVVLGVALAGLFFLAALVQKLGRGDILG